MSAFPVKAVLISAIEAAVNHYLRLDDDLERLLTPMAGKVICLKITPGDEILYICPTPTGLRFLDHYAGEPDAELQGSLWALGFMGMSATPMRALYRGDVRLGGDLRLAGRFQRVFAKLDIDLHGKIARYAGEDVADRLSAFLSGGAEWTRRGLTHMRWNIEEFLQEETRQLPAKAEAELWFSAVDDLRLTVERAEARVRRLEHLLSAKASDRLIPFMPSEPSSEPEL